MSSVSRILVVEDDRETLSVITLCLEQEGYQTMQAEDGEAGLNLALKEKPDLVALDLDLPVLSGLHVCEELRRREFQAPILMLTGRANTRDKVLGLDAGADDYLAKPFEPNEFLARIRALLRRGKRTQPETLVLEFGPVRIDLKRRLATREDQPLELTKTEYALLDLLAKNSDHPVSREKMLEVIWGYDRTPSTRTVDTHIWRLRKKINDAGDEPRWIKGVQGHGYRLVGSTVVSGP